MYTDQMARAVASIECPRNFYLDILDNDNFVTLLIPAERLLLLTHDDKMAAVQYMIKVKAAIESLGGIVLVVRTELGENE